MTTATINRMCVSRCEHCGLEIEASSEHQGACPRCDRTFFVSRWYTPYTPEMKRQDDLIAASKIEQKRQARRQFAADIRKLRNTGWYGFQYFAPADRAAQAKRVLAQRS